MKDEKKKVYRDHLGIEYSSINEMAMAYGISKQTFEHRILNGLSLKDALETPYEIGNDIDRFYIDHVGNKYKSLKDMCNVYGIKVEKYRAEIKLGISKEKILSEDSSRNVSKKKHCGKRCKDHLGNEYISISEMCRVYGLDSSLFSRRISNGVSLQEALTKKSLIGCKDHLGNEYNSIEEMCKTYGINRTTFNYRINQGWKLEDALTKP